jgi:hypothetical protein
MASNRMKVATVQVRKVKAGLLDMNETGLAIFARCPRANYEEGVGFKLEVDEHLLIVASPTLLIGCDDQYWLVDGDTHERPTPQQIAEVLVRAHESEQVSEEQLREIARGDKLLQYASYIKAKAWLSQNVC